MVTNSVLVILSLPLLMLSAAGSLAQSEEKAAEIKAENAAAASDEKPETKDKAPASKKGDAPEIFIPSEAISEDLSVSFPVDI